MRGNGRGMQITDMARGAALAKTLGKGPLALLRGHGNAVVGLSVKQAAIFAAYTDINARMQERALQIDHHIIAMDEPELFEPWEFDINRPGEFPAKTAVGLGAYESRSSRVRPGNVPDKYGSRLPEKVKGLPEQTGW